MKKNNDFLRVFKFGRTFFSSGLVIKWMQNNLDYFRFGLVISTKIDKRAAKRNKIKRRLRAIFRETAEKIKPGFDFVIIIKPAIKEMDFHQKKAVVLNFLEKNNLLCLKK
ncbi:ribonuclease P protein component [Candidatus Kuenenbacteria bacterium]|nr:ribonuclease P protein component [Candidatus Kuenenbacteria bacterium]